jgi:hypothetical protein
MKPTIHVLFAVLTALAVALAPVSAQTPAPAAPAAAASNVPPFKAEELEQLVAPIALYPDALVAQILMATTYPLEVVEAARWQKANPSLKEKALEDALEKQSWDPSVKSLTVFPTVLAMLNEKLDMTQKLGDAFLAQQKEVLAAVQRLRGKADQAGNLKSTKEQNVTKAQEGGTTVIKIEPTNPQTVYVPTYTSAVYGPWPYPAYPPYSYYPGYYPGAALFAFTAGAIVGGALWGGCNWGGGDVTINRNIQNNFTRNTSGQGGSGNWSHNAEHRKGAGYRDQASQQKFGGGQQRPGADSREQFRGRAEQGRQELGSGDRGGNRGGPSAGTSDRAGPGGDRGGDRGGPSAGTSDRGGGGFGGGDRGGGGDFGGGRGGSGPREPGGFSGMDRGGSQTRMTSDRGAASRSSFAGGGGGRTGGAGGHMGGGGRGGGGGGRGGRR